MSLVVAVSVVPEPWHDVAVLVEPLVDRPRDDLDLGVGLVEGPQSLGGADEVQELDVALADAVVLEHLDGHLGRAWEVQESSRKMYYTIVTGPAYHVEKRLIMKHPNIPLAICGYL